MIHFFPLKSWLANVKSFIYEFIGIFDLAINGICLSISRTDDRVFLEEEEECVSFWGIRFEVSIVDSLLKELIINDGFFDKSIYAILFWLNDRIVWYIDVIRLKPWSYTA